ncbi:MAG: hypothetical protein ACKOPS_11560, partial [Cyanobium sp.]
MGLDLLLEKRGGAGLIGQVAGHHQGELAAAGGGDRQIAPLVGGEPAEEEQVAAIAGAGAVVTAVHRVGDGDGRHGHSRGGALVLTH